MLVEVVPWEYPTPTEGNPDQHARNKDGYAISGRGDVSVQPGWVGLLFEGVGMSLQSVFEWLSLRVSHVAVYLMGG